MLANEQFTSKAPPHVVEGHRTRLAASRERLATLEQRLREVG
jgi:hypothetical protein